MSNNEVNSNNEIGCLRGIMSMFIALIFTIAVGIAAYKTFGIWQTLVAVLISSGISLMISIHVTNTNKPISLVDCILPLVLSIIAAIIFSPVAIFAGNFFSVFTCIGAGICLSLGLFLYRRGKISGKFLILPALTFVYEILPIDLTTDIDNVIALSLSTLSSATGYTLDKLGIIKIGRKM